MPSCIQPPWAAPAYLHRHEPDDIAALAAQVPERAPWAIGETGWTGLCRISPTSNNACWSGQLDEPYAFDLPMERLRAQGAHDASVNTLRR